MAKRTRAMPTAVRAHVLIKGPRGSLSKADETVSSKTISQFLAKPERIEATSEKLAELGFEVIGKSPLQVTVEAPRRQFEEVFHSSLQPLAVPKTKKALGPGYWKWRKPPVVPEALQELVDGVIFPRPLKTTRK